MSKYKSKKTVIDNIKFDSGKEANRYSDLLLMQKTGEISELKLQPVYILQDKFQVDIAGTNKKRAIRAIKYVGDFQYLENGLLVVEDVKSTFTAKLPVFRIKKKLFLKKYPDILFREFL